ncbi:MAG TPA: carboxypeptidase regulatory-like domain-containing protein [Vicinamibacterales bacterium]|nr:carboxypeptidase regulatory-like domain-containing protein [Vicinamibacterales bacterium]
MITFAAGPLVLALVLAQMGAVTPSQLPPRDTSAQPKGTAIVTGKVVSADTGRPIRRAQVTLSAPELGSTRTMSTNSQGIFEFTEIAAGRYSIAAVRGGYLRLQFGQRHPGEPGRPVQVEEGQRVTNIDFALPRASTIVGRITDEIGDPLPNVSIFPVQVRYFRGQRRVVPVPGGISFNRTDETGQYRINGLEPGEYMVLASSRDAWNDEKNPKERIGYLPTYSGGTTNPADAMRVKVGVGHEVMMADFAMVPGRVGTIAGTAVSSSGMPLAGESVAMSQEFTGPGTGMSMGAAGGKIGPDGSFTIQNVTPGEYKLTVGVPARDGRPAEGAVTTVFFGGTDLSGITLVTSPGATVRGRVVTDTGEPLSTDVRMRVSSRPVHPSQSYSRFDQENGRVRDDLTFELIGVFGESRLSLLPLPPGWQLRSIDYQGTDLADTALPFAPGQVLDGVTVVLTKRLPAVRGTLSDEKGQRGDGSLIVFPEDAAKWSEESRLIRTTRPDPNGVFEFAHMVPGEYLLAAVEYVRDHERFDPQFLETLRERATKVRVDEAAAPLPVSVTLRRAR